MIAEKKITLNLTIKKPDKFITFLDIIGAFIWPQNMKDICQQ